MKRISGNLNELKNLANGAKLSAIAVPSSSCNLANGAAKKLSSEIIGRRCGGAAVPPKAALCTSPMAALPIAKIIAAASPKIFNNICFSLIGAWRILEFGQRGVMDVVSSSNLKICDSAANVIGDLGIAYSSVSGPLSNWFGAFSKSLKMMCTVLEKRSIFGGIFKTQRGETAIGPFFDVLSAWGKLIPFCLVNANMCNGLSKGLPLAVRMVDTAIKFSSAAIRKNSIYEGIFKTSSGEIVVGPLFGALSVFAKLASVCATGTNFSATFACFSVFCQKAELAAKIFDAAKNFSRIIEGDSTRDKIFSLLKCASACLLLVVQMWLSATGFGIVGAGVYKGMATLIFMEMDRVFFTFNRKYDLLFSAARGVLSETKLLDKLAKPAIDFFVPQHP
jgi:hypothetical protein